MSLCLIGAIISALHQVGFSDVVCDIEQRMDGRGRRLCVVARCPCGGTDSIGTVYEPIADTVDDVVNGVVRLFREHLQSEGLLAA
jgi:hypothetical protein